MLKPDDYDYWDYKEEIYEDFFTLQYLSAISYICAQNHQMHTVLKFYKATFKHNNNNVFENLTWEIKKGEHWAIAGKAGSGKTSLLQVLEGKFLQTGGDVIHCFGNEPEHDVRELEKYAAFVFFQNQEINYNRFYYQQRFNSTEVEGTFTVREFLGNPDLTDPYASKLFDDFHIYRFLDSEFIKLSNGETRKILIAKALLKKPKLLVLDNPYLGLDSQARIFVNTMIDGLIQNGIQVILTGESTHLPKRITHVLHLNNFCINSYSKRREENKRSPSIDFANPLVSFAEGEDTSFEIAVKLTDVVVRYDDFIVLDHVNWTIRRNEKWALTGHNGAGKSMLMNLMYADHPQAYANTLMLFDKLRGQGESIWDIKEKIGYVSPELHFYCNKLLTCHDLALEDLFSHPYRRKTITKEYKEMLNFFFQYFNIDRYSGTPLRDVSTGIQRLVLFIRALMKKPVLLLLDEPFQNFDEEMIEKAKLMLDAYCKTRTLVFISHCDQEIPLCIDKRAVLNKGKLTLEKC